MEKNREWPAMISGFLVLFILLSGSCSPVNTAVNAGPEGIAIKGFDPVAYFTIGKPLKGTEEFTYKWKGATWLFSDREHLDLFAADPERYAPKYGGYCAYAVSRGTTADIDPDAWSIVDGKLYLNLNKDVRKLWSDDIRLNIEKADRNWPSVISK